MGKGTKRRRRPNQQNSHAAAVQDTSSLPDPPKKHKAVVANTTNTKDKDKTQLPIPFPTHNKHLNVPQGAFLRNEPPHQQAFQAALDTSYQGFCVDPPNSSILIEQESVIQTALDTLEQKGLFRTDVTQPFGLGTKCAKTYVTRCLLGNQGTTYKYLGLRMFSYPWNTNSSSDSNNSSESNSNNDFQKAVRTIARLNQSLTVRTQHHLTELTAKRNDNPCRGRAGFDIALINRMQHSKNLKPEPSVGEGRCSVSWHADSSLEHYSSIAVYHTLPQQTEKQQTKKNDNTNTAAAAAAWSVALRVAHHSEGPTAASARRATTANNTTDVDTAAAVATTAPPIAVSLPSGSTYYLLDDFNHHHQHAVLAHATNDDNDTTTNNNNNNVRYSSTHRLLRDSHNVNYVLTRCKNACGGFHKKGPKVWRSEQLLLHDLESEWLRQYFIQAGVNCSRSERMWGVWGESITSLLQYWAKLEARTKQVVDLLQHAAYGKCIIMSSSSSSSAEKQGPPPPKSVRKLRDKRRKAVTTVKEILERDGGSRRNAVELLFAPMIVVLKERATMRELWLKRENDHAFHEMEPCDRPMPIPFEFNVVDVEAQSSEQTSLLMAKSPMPGTADDLRSLCSDLEACGRAWLSGNSNDLPAAALALTAAAAATATTAPMTAVKVASTPVQVLAPDITSHARPLTWKGWKKKNKTFGLELQSPWAELLLQGKKTIETRLYDLPPALIGKRIDILCSVKGTAGVSSLADSIALGADSKAAAVPVQRLGWCTFTRVIQYTDKTLFQADQASHLVTSSEDSSGYGWKNDGTTQVIYGWKVGDFGTYADKRDFAGATILERRMRSLFEIIKRD